MGDSRKDSRQQKEDVERAREYHRELRERNAEHLREYQREYYERNKDKMREKRREKFRAYNNEHADEIMAYRKEYYERNKDKIRAYRLDRRNNLHERWDGSKDELDIKIEEAINKCTSKYPYKFSIVDIAEQLGVSSSTVRNRMIKMGINTSSEELNKKIIDIIEAYRLKGLDRPSMQTIADQTGVCVATVRKRMISMGIDTTRIDRVSNKKIKEPEKDELNIKILKFIEEYTKENGRVPSLRRIGAEFDVSRQTIHNMLTSLGVTTERVHRTKDGYDPLWEEIHKLIEQGIKNDGLMPQTAELAEKLCVSYGAVQCRLNKHGYARYNYKERRNMIIKTIEEYTDKHNEIPSITYVCSNTGIPTGTVSRVMHELGYDTQRKNQMTINKAEVDRKILAMVHEAERRGVKRPTIQKIADETGISLQSARSRMIALGIDTSRQ